MPPAAPWRPGIRDIMEPIGYAQPCFPGGMLMERTHQAATAANVSGVEPVRGCRYLRYLIDRDPKANALLATAAAEPGNTPLVQVNGVFTKLECVNPSNSIKDRIAKYILDESERRGLLKPGMTIVEATSGNTGIAMSYYGAKKGYRVIIVMPENMTEERKQVIRDLGAELVLCSAGNFSEAAAIRDEMATQPGYFNPDQFSNPLNVECHCKTTGKEIVEQISGSAARIDAFVAGVGTGGTLIGVGQALREKFPKVHIVAVEPSESAVMSGKQPGIHGIQGIGDGFIPLIASDGRGGLNPMINDILCVSTDEARRAALSIQEKSGYCVGISSGANLVAAQKLRRTHQTVVTVFADGYAKYRSFGLGGSRGRCRFETPTEL